MTEHRFLAKDEWLVPAEYEPFCVLCGKPAAGWKRISIHHVENAAGERIQGRVAGRVPYCRGHFTRLQILFGAMIGMLVAAMVVLVAGGQLHWSGWVVAVAAAIPFAAFFLIRLMLVRGGITGHLRFVDLNELALVYADGRVPDPQTARTSRSKAIALLSSKPKTYTHWWSYVAIAAFVLSLGLKVAELAGWKKERPLVEKRLTLAPGEQHRQLVAVRREGLLLVSAERAHVGAVILRGEVPTAEEMSQAGQLSTVGQETATVRLEKASTILVVTTNRGSSAVGTTLVVRRE